MMVEEFSVDLVLMSWLTGDGWGVFGGFSINESSEDRSIASDKKLTTSITAPIISFTSFCCFAN